VRGQFSYWPSCTDPAAKMLYPAGDSSAYTLQSMVDEYVVSHVSGLTALHAGVLVRDNAALLLPGQSHAGKSTLVQQLIRDGWLYYSDEYAFLDNDARVHPYPRTMFVRDAQGESQAVPVSTPAGGPAVPVRAVVELRYAADAHFTVTPVPQSEAVIRLLKNTPRELEQDVEVFSRMVALASRGNYFTGVRGEAALAADELLRLFEGLA